MYSCLENFIGVDKTIAISKSGLYLTTLGFTLKKMKSVTPDLAVLTPLDFANEMLERAAMFCQDDILHHVPSVLFNNVIEQVVMPNFLNTYQPYFSGERGVKVRKFSLDRFPLRGFKISKIHVKGNDTVAGKTVKIIDGNTVTIFTIDLVAGETYTIENVDYSVKNESFEVVMDFSNVQAANPTEFLAYCGSCSGSWKNIDKFEIQSAYGISVDFTYECRDERIFCQILPYVKYALLYRTGIEVLQEMQASDRVNFFTIHKQDWVEKSLEKWQKEYETSLTKHLSQISRLVRNIDHCCFESKRYQVFETIL